MRKNLRAAYDAWQQHRPARPAASCWTDGTTLYSYDTAILTRAGDGQRVLNMTRYSRTTSTQQHALAAVVEAREVSGLPRGATVNDLMARATW